MRIVRIFGGVDPCYGPSQFGDRAPVASVLTNVWIAFRLVLVEEHRLADALTTTTTWFDPPTGELP